MAVFTILRKESTRATPQLGQSADTLSAPGKLVVATAGADVSANGEVLRVGGETQIDGLLRGPFTGGGLTIGKPGAAAGQGSTLIVASFTTAQRAFLTAAVGMSIYNSTLNVFQSYNGTRWADSASNNNYQATVDPTVSNDTTQGYTKGSFWLQTTTNVLWTCFSATTGAAIWKPTLTAYPLILGGRLDIPGLPLTGVGTELADGAATLTYFQARRGTAGTSGTTTIQLEINGAAVAGATLSWTGGTDASNALKNVAINQVVALGDRITLRLTAVEAGSPQDIFAQVW